MGYEFVEFEVQGEARITGWHSDALPLPEAVRLAAHVRDGQLLPIHPAQLLKIGDIVCLIAPLSARETLAELFTPGAKAPHLQQQRFFGDFVLDGGARFGDVAAMYGFAAEGEEGDLSLAAALHQRLRGRAVVGDSVAFGKLMLTVREMDGKAITRVGLKLR
jgi:cell volume regulation protein A